MVIEAISSLAADAVILGVPPVGSRSGRSEMRRDLSHSAATKTRRHIRRLPEPQDKGSQDDAVPAMPVPRGVPAWLRLERGLLIVVRCALALWSSERRKLLWRDRPRPGLGEEALVNPSRLLRGGIDDLDPIARARDDLRLGARLGDADDRG